MYKSLAKTLFVGKNLIFLTTCHSTNEEAADRVRKGRQVEGTIIITDNQTRGRGQQSNRWWSEPGKNLTFSLILHPKELRVDEQFLLNTVTSLAITDVLQPLFPGAVVKWPNDIYVKDEKLGGILIQNTLSGNRIHTSIIGIGLNVNQTDFAFPGATSISVQTGVNYDLEQILEEIGKQLEVRYMQLRAGNGEKLMEEYKSKLYRWEEKHMYQADGDPFEARIIDVLPSGELVLQTEGDTRRYRFKEVRFL